MAEIYIGHFKLTFLEPPEPLQASMRGLGFTPAGLAIASTSKPHQMLHSLDFIQMPKSEFLSLRLLILSWIFHIFFSQVRCPALHPAMQKKYGFPT